MSDLEFVNRNAGHHGATGSKAKALQKSGAAASASADLENG